MQPSRRFHQRDTGKQLPERVGKYLLPICLLGLGLALIWHDSATEFQRFMILSVEYIEYLSRFTAYHTKRDKLIW